VRIANLNDEKGVLAIVLQHTDGLLPF